ncbi:MAG: ABC transporter permease [Chloroflexota bacterium]|nr:ABC transporter permease [Chloroflexota bacterium]
MSTNAVLITPPAAGIPRALALPTGRLARTWRRFRRQRLSVISLIIVGVIALAGLLAPVIAPYDPAAISGNFMAGPSAAHWFGSDGTGRDLLSRMLFGARLSLLGTLIAVSVGGSAGIVLGMVSGYAGGLLDMLVMRCIDALLSFPGLLTAMVLVAVLGSGEVQAMVGLAVAFMPFITRVVRGQVLAVREEDYVEAAKVIGAPTQWIVRRHVLANILPPLIIVLAQLLGAAIVVEGALAFLGISVQPPQTSLGSLLQDGFANINVTPRLIVIPGVAITLLATSFNAIADGLRDALANQDFEAS